MLQKSLSSSFKQDWSTRMKLKWSSSTSIFMHRPLGMITGIILFHTFHTNIPYKTVQIGIWKQNHIKNSAVNQVYLVVIFNSFMIRFINLSPACDTLNLILSSPYDPCSLLSQNNYVQAIAAIFQMILRLETQPLISNHLKEKKTLKSKCKSSNVRPVSINCLKCYLCLNYKYMNGKWLN